MATHPGGVLAAFLHEDAAVTAIRQLKDMGYKDMTVYTPAPNHAVMDAVGHKISPVRMWTLIGGLIGVTSGFAMTLWMSLDYPIVVGGKPLASWIPYVVIAFELTILIGALSTLTGLVVHILLTRKKAAYDPRFTDDHIGIFVPCPTERRGAVEQMLTAAGAAEVRVAA